MTKQTYLVVVDSSKEMPVALHYAARRAHDTGALVALLRVVEVDTIETWGGVERAVLDEAFTGARKEMAVYEKEVEDITGVKPQTYYRKGERRKALLDVIENEPSITTLVLAAGTKDGASNPLIQYLTSDKGLRKLRVPLVIVPDICEKFEKKEEA